MYSQPNISNKHTMKQPSRHDDNVKSDRDYLSIDFYSVNNWLNSPEFGDAGENLNGPVGLSF